MTTKNIKIFGLVPSSAQPFSFFPLHRKKGSHGKKTPSLFYFLLAGVKFHPNFSSELHYMDVGESSLNIPVGGTLNAEGVTLAPTIATGPISATVSGKSIGLSVLASTNEHRGFSAFGKIGFHKWDTETELSVGTLGLGNSDDGTDFLFGAGLQYRIVENLAVRAQYEVLRFENDDVDYANVGLTFSF